MGAITTGRTKTRRLPGMEDVWVFDFMGLRAARVAFEGWILGFWFATPPVV